VAPVHGAQMIESPLELGDLRPVGNACLVEQQLGAFDVEYRLMIVRYVQRPVRRWPESLAVLVIGSQLDVAYCLDARDVDHDVDYVRGIDRSAQLARRKIVVGDESRLGEDPLTVALEIEIDERTVEDFVRLAPLSQHLLERAIPNGRREVLLDLMEDDRLHFFEVGVWRDLDVGANANPEGGDRRYGEKILAQAAMGVEHATDGGHRLGTSPLLLPEQRKQIVPCRAKQDGADALRCYVQGWAVRSR